MSQEAIQEMQIHFCRLHKAEFLPCLGHSILGRARNVVSSNWPLNGLRHLPVGGTSGWYIWCGNEPSSDDDFFEPVHVEHLLEARPEVTKFLGLAPGWRFYVDRDFVDVWFQPSLLVE